ncbi:MAG: ectonucleotide pyrophosphatase/phosphodiesterase [Candidatus Acidiferrales bacterium]
MKKHGQKRSFMLRLLLVAVVLIATYDGASAGARIAAGRQTLHAGRQSQNQQSGAPVLAPPIAAEHGPNSAEQQAKHYVILVSLDGFRYDYPQKYDAKNLIELGARGASAPEGMIPAYPSITFPNHYTIVTGLYPEHHGIVANTFYDPARKQVYSYREPQTVTDGSWYGGTPLWVLAEQQGMRAACFFWPGSEADIQGTRPSYYMKYDAKYPNDKRVEEVLEWLQLPPERRPHFVTLYFSDVDSVGHAHGPDGPEEAAAVHQVDQEIGSLEAGLAKLKLPVDVIVVADHGMISVEGAWIDLDQYFDTSLLEKSEDSLIYAKSGADAAMIYDGLNGKSDKFRAYRRGLMPESLHFDGNPREGDPIVVPTGPYLIRVSEPPAPPAGAAGNAMAGGHGNAPPVGAHGYDAAHMPEMKAIFYAAGPDIRSGATVPPFENVNVYPLIAHILKLDISNLKTGPIDGKLTVLQGVLKNPS